MAEMLSSFLARLELDDVDEEEEEEKDASSDEDTSMFEFAITSVVAGATFAEFSLPRFVTLTGAEPPRGFPAATLRTQAGVFCAFTSGKVILANSKTEADAHRALVDLARETGYKLAVPPATLNLVCEVPTHQEIDVEYLAEICHTQVGKTDDVLFWLSEGRVEVRVNASGLMRISHVRSVAELRRAARTAEHIVSSCAKDAIEE